MDLTRFADSYWNAKDDRVDDDRQDLLCRLVPVGCEVLVIDGGPGMLAARLASRGVTVRQTDLSLAATERAQRKGITATQVDLDDDPLPFEDASFGCVISDSGLEHRYYPENGVRESFRVLRPGGTFILLLPNIAHWRHRLQLLRGTLPEVLGAATDRCHLRFFALPQMRQMVREHGFVVTAVKGFPSLWVKGLYPRVFRTRPVAAFYRGLCRLRPSFFGRDVILVCRKPD